MRITNLLLCLFVLVLLLIPGGKSAAQTSPIGKFYFVTYEPVTEENQYMGQTATIWEGDASTGTSRHLLDVPPYVNQTPRELYSKSELELLAESKYFPADVLDDTWKVGQGLATIALLDAEYLLVVIYRQTHEVQYNTSYGYYDLQLLNLSDASLTSIMTLDYHQPFVEESWNCISDYTIGFSGIQPNPVTSTFAFSLVPYNNCGCQHRCMFGQTYLVDYSNLPVQVEILPFVREFSWSPDGSAFAYILAPCPDFSPDPCIASIYTRLAAPESTPELVFQFELRLDHPKVVTWLDADTLLYQYDGERLFVDSTENAFWSVYDLRSKQVVFTQELKDGYFWGFGYLQNQQSRIVYGYRASGLVQVHFTEVTGIAEVETISEDSFYSLSKFKEYSFFRRVENNQVQILTADQNLFTFDLSPYLPADSSKITWLLAGPPPAGE